MKQLLFLTTFLLLALSSFSQITYRKVTKQEVIIPYDSLENIPVSNIKAIYGHQALILSKSHFKTGVNTMDKPDPSQIINKTYTVVSGVKDKYKKPWLAMALQNDTVYYELSTNSVEYPSFIMLEHYEKQKQLYVGKSFKLRLFEDFTELNTGMEKRFTKDDNFICSEITILETKVGYTPSLILKNQNGEEIGIPLETYSNKIDKFTIQ